MPNKRLPGLQKCSPGNLLFGILVRLLRGPFLNRFVLDELMLVY